MCDMKMNEKRAKIISDFIVQMVSIEFYIDLNKNFNFLILILKSTLMYFTSNLLVNIANQFRNTYIICYLTYLISHIFKQFKTKISCKC